MEKTKQININYYNENSDTFIEGTINADVSNLYHPFELKLKPNAKILDLGCGSGRDSKYFFDKGYDVVAIDPSIEMCKSVKRLVDIPVYQLFAQEITFENEFDAVWACASLLHVEMEEMETVLRKIEKALKENGVLYASWKYGDSQRYSPEGRVFTDLNERKLLDILKNIPELIIEEQWVSTDVRPNRADVKWLNVILRKIETNKE